MSDIWDYSYSQWGAGLADAYVLAIHAACEGLVTAVATGRLAGQSAEHIRMGFRKQIVGSHLVFFKSNASGVVDVVRILSQRMDVASHL